MDTRWTSLGLEALGQEERQKKNSVWIFRRRRKCVCQRMVRETSDSGTMKPTLSVSMDQSSSLASLANDHQIPNPAHVGESTSISVHISNIAYDLCLLHNISVVGTELTSFVLSEGLDQKDRKFGLAESAFVPCCTDGAALEKHLTESAQTKHEIEKAKNGLRKYKHKKEINLPRRASKRLAGIKVDPVPELKTSNRARRVAVNQSYEGKMITNVDERPCCLPIGIVKQFDAVEAKSGQSEYYYGKLSTPEKLPEKIVEEHGTDKDQECFSFWPLENQGTVEGKLDYSLDLPLGELLTDPCITLAIQTLTGVTFETYYKSSQMSSETLAAAEGQNIGDEREGSKYVLSPPENLTIPKECAAAAADDDEIGHTDKGNENPGPSSETPLDISWMDPCIEFAIKTLTGSGTIPLDTNSNSKNFLQRQLGSSNAHGHCEMAL
ncbi:methyl-CpG-binding domain-containing protein 13 [Spatholobus suberectus]|nr:methyl-CpG-binding domain-containing protein 13 [Spatholobus suberectus]